MKRTVFVTMILSVGFLFSVQAQISHGGKPLPLTLIQSKSDSFFKEMPAFDVAEELHLDSLNESDLRSGYRFAYKFMTDFSRNNSGVSFILPDGTRVWRLGIRSKGALSINVLFTEYELPEGAKLFLYNSDQSHILGSFNYLNNSDLDMLPVAPVYGDELIIEYQEPAQADFPGRLKVGEVNHGYRNFKGKEPADTQTTMDCMPPVACYADMVSGSDSLARSAVLLIINGTTGCSGVLVNNTANDGKPYLLTASHCLNMQFMLVNPDYAKIASTIVSFFNYESPLCSQILRGAEEMSMASSYIRAVNEEHDMALVELLETPPVYYRPYYAGWNASDGGAAPYANIHHPGGSVKRVNLFDGELDLTTYDIPAYPFAQNAHWHVSQWTEGSTVNGSSGSPLFDNKGLVIGGLTGGYSTCSKPVNDYFFAVSQAWTPSPYSSRQLKHWLDPGDTQQLTCEGLDPYGKDIAYRLSNVRASGKQDSVVITTIAGSDTIPLFGNNGNGVTEYAEAYHISQEAKLHGSYFVTSATGSTGDMIVEASVYSGDNKPETLLHTERFLPTYTNKADGEETFTETTKPLNRRQESYIQFSEPVTVSGSFFISYRIVSAPDKTYFSAYNLKTTFTPTNTSWIKGANGWTAASLYSGIGYKTSFYIDPVVQYTHPLATEKVERISPVRIFTDPDRLSLYIVLPEGIEDGECLLYSTDGKLIQRTHLHENYSKLQIAPVIPGIYIAKVVYKNVSHTQKIRF